MVHVQTILYASLAASLLSALLAMLGKQWLNRYASTDVRGSAVERSQNRQRKLDGIIRWYFDYVLESLPLMLQVALLLLGCALSRYLWEISRTIASVVIGVTSFGLLFYLFILAVGTVWESCPYQTPGSTLFRYLGPRVPRIVHSTASAAGNILKASVVANFVTHVRKGPDSSSWRDVIRFLANLMLAPLRSPWIFISLDELQSRDCPLCPLVPTVFSAGCIPGSIPHHAGSTSEQPHWTCDAFYGRSRHPSTNLYTSQPFNTSSRSRISPVSIQTSSCIVSTSLLDASASAMARWWSPKGWSISQRCPQYVSPEPLTISLPQTRLRVS
jgi:hypothetical protein